MRWKWVWPWQRTHRNTQGAQDAPPGPAHSVPPVEPEGEQALRVYIRCQACGEPIPLRIRLTDEVGRADEGSPFAYFVQKTVIGSGRRPPGSRRPPCFRPIELRLELDSHYRVIGGALQGGVWLTPDQYEQAQREWSGSLTAQASTSSIEPTEDPDSLA